MTQQQAGILEGIRPEQKEGRPSLGGGRALLFVTFGLAAAIGLYQLVYLERIFLGVRAGEVDLGALKPPEARRLLAANYGALDRMPVVFRYGERQWKFSPLDLGYRFDPDLVVAQAMALGREGGLLERFLTQGVGLLAGHSLPPALVVESTKRDHAIERLTQEIDRPARNASLKVEGGGLLTVPSQTGRELDRASLERLLSAHLAAVSREPIDLPVTERMPILLEPDLEAARAQVALMTQATVQLSYIERNWTWADGPVAQERERQWTLEPRAILNLIGFAEEKDERGRLRLVATLDDEKAKSYAAQLAKEVNQEPRDARFDWNGGQLKPLLTSRNRHTLNTEAFVQLLASAVKSPGDRQVPVPVITQKASVAMEDVARMGIVEKVTERSTYYGASQPERAYNVELGATKIHGVVVPPGADFSFNQTVGEISQRNGFQLGFSIIGRQTLPDFGGGICQVSTTLFQSAFWSGQSILERWPHAYRIRHYEEPLAGLDATIYPPHTDFKFRNDTGHYLLIQARTDGKRLYVSLYGTNPKWEVRVEEPILRNVRPADPQVIREYSPLMAQGRQVWVEKAEDGVDITVRRTVLQDGKELRRLDLTSRYRPQRNVLLIGTGS